MPGEKVLLTGESGSGKSTLVNHVASRLGSESVVLHCRGPKEDAAAVLARESGKVFDEARAEVIEGLHMVQYVYGTARQPTGQVIESEIAAKDLYVRRKPRGVVARADKT